MNEQEKIAELYNRAQKTSDDFSKFARENYKKEQEAKKIGGDGPRPLTKSDKDDRSTARRIQREIKRYESTGRISNFLNDQIRKSQSQNYTDNSSSNILTPSPSANIETQQFSQPAARTTESKINYILAQEQPKCVLGLYVNGLQVWVNAGTIANQLPEDFDPATGKFIASSESGYAWAEVEIDEDTGDITSVGVYGGASTPANTDSKFYYTLGYFSYSSGGPTVTNYGCGSIDVTICRNWFTTEPPFYGISLQRV